MWRRLKREHDLDQEIQSHLAFEEQQRIERGESPEEARANARREFGNVGLVKEVTREVWGWPGLEQLTQDARDGVRFTMRMFRTEAVVTMMIIVTLGIAIGANTTIFTFANALLFRAEFGELYDIGRNRGAILGPLSYPDYIDLKRESRSFSGMAAYRNSVPLGLSGPDGATPVYGTFVSTDFFELLGVSLESGRSFLHSEDSARAPVAILSHELNHTLGRPAEIALNGRSFEVVGVAPESFPGFRMARSDVWLPLGVQPLVSPESGSLVNRRSSWLRLIARLNTGVTRAGAESEVLALGVQLDQTDPLGRDVKRSYRLAPHTKFGSGPPVYTMVAVLLGIVIIILLIACSNVAGIGIVRAMARKREIAVRLAIGASRGRVIRQLLCENLAMYGLAGIAGGVIASGMTSLLIYGLRLADPLITIDLSADFRVAALTILLTAGAGIVFGLEPAFQAMRLDVASAMKQDTLSASSRSRVRNGLVVAQVALSSVLLVSGGLFLRTMLHAYSFNPGFQTDDVWVVSLNFGLGGHPETRARQFAQDLLEQLSGLPEVASAGFTVDAPLDGSRSTRDFDVDGAEVQAGYNHVSPGYFATLGLPILHGRNFTESDNETSPRVAIVSQSGAEKLWPGRNPVGHRLGDMEVIGVAANSRTASLGFSEEAAVFYYSPLAQNYQSEQTLLIRAVKGANPIPGMRATLRAVNPNLPILALRPMRDVVTSGLLSQRLAAWAAGTMGVLGLVLAAASLYAVTSHAVVRRRREIGIRAALGAPPAEIVRLVVRNGVLLTIIGLTFGLAAALGVSRLIAGMLFGIGPADPATFGATVLILTLVSAVASFVPARQATRVDPSIALRHE